MLESMLSVLDSSLVAVTLPRMQGSFSATQDEVSLVVTTYLVAIVAFTPIAGAISTRVGRKRVLLWAVGGFILMAVMAGRSESLLEMVIFRFLQGTFGAGLVPVGQATIFDTHPRDEVGAALGYLAMAMVLGLSIGPTAAGYVTEAQTWRWIFAVHVAIGLLAFVMIWAFVPESDHKSTVPINYLGYAPLAISVAALQILLSRGGRLDWFESTEIVLLAGVSAGCFYVFCVHMWMSSNPFLDPAMFRDWNYVIGVLCGFGFVFLMVAFLVLFPAFLQQLRGYPIEAAGVVMGIRAMVSMPASVIAGYLNRWMDLRIVAAFGFFGVGLACWQIAQFTADVGYRDVMIAALTFGVGSGFAFVPVNVLTFATLEVRHRSNGTSVMSSVMNIGGSLGVSLMVANLVRESQINHALLASYVTPYTELRQNLVMPDAWDLADPSGRAALDAVVSNQALMLSYVSDFQWMAAVACAVALLSLLLRSVGRVAGPARQGT